MSNKPGKFTQQFDTEILKKLLDTPEDDSLSREIQEKLGYISEKLEKRKMFLLERFSNAQAVDTAKGVVVTFKSTADHPSKGQLEFAFSLNEETHAIHLDYSMTLGDGPCKKDYIMLALKKFSTDKIDNFIETKILQFARLYMEGEQNGN